MQFSGRVSAAGALSLGCSDWSERKDSGSLVGEEEEGKAIRRPEQTRGGPLRPFAHRCARS